MPTLEEIGKATKQKYPQYAGKTDTEVGQAVVDKYPEYKAKLTPTGPTDSRNVLQKVADLAGVGGVLDTATTALQAPLTRKILKDNDAQIKALTKQSLDFIKQAKNEKDPTKRQALLDQSRQIDTQISNAGSGANRVADIITQGSRVTPDEMNMSNGEFATRRGIRTAAEIGSYIVPGAQVPGATAGARIAQAAGRGAISGGLQGIAGSAKSSKNVLDAAIRVGSGAAVGGTVAGLLSSIGELGQSASNKFPKKAGETDLSTQLNETKRVMREGDVTVSDKFRSSQFLAYKNKSNTDINPTETAKVLDNLGMKYRNSDQLVGKAQQLARNIEDIKITTLENQGGNIDVAPVTDIFKSGADKSLNENINTEKLFRGLVKQAAGSQGLEGATPIQANKLASEMGKEAEKYYTSSTNAFGEVIDPDKFHIYEGLRDAKNFIRDQIDEKFAESIAYKPEQLQGVSSYSEKLAKALEDKSISLADLNYVQKNLLDAIHLSKDTIKALSGAGQQVAGGRSFVGTPIISQAGDVANQALDVLATPAKSAVRSGTSNVLTKLADLAGNTGRGITGAVSRVGLKNPTLIINPAVAALQRLMDKEGQYKQAKPVLK